METINNMLDVRRLTRMASAMRAKHAEERSDVETYRECPRDASRGSIESLAEFDKENAPPRTARRKPRRRLSARASSRRRR